MVRKSPDDSLIADESYLPAKNKGLTYPLGDRIPGAGDLVDVGAGVRWARLPLGGSLGHINSWIIEDRDALGDGVAIVDTGMFTPESIAAWEALFAGPLAGVRVTRVMATHFHPDHVGMAGWLCDRFDCALWMSRDEWLTMRLIIAESSNTPPIEIRDSWQRAGWSKAQIDEVSAAGWSRFSDAVSPLRRAYVRMIDSDQIDFGDRRWQVVMGNGHSPEHACLWNADASMLISGDQILPKISSNVSLIAHEPEGSPLHDWLDSIANFLGFPADMFVLPAHGLPFRGAHNRLAYMRDQHVDRLNALEVHLAQPQRVVDCFPVLFRREVSGFDLALATGEALAHLRWLDVEGRAVVSMRDGVAWYTSSVG